MVSSLSFGGTQAMGDHFNKKYSLLVKNLYKVSKYNQEKLNKGTTVPVFHK